MLEALINLLAILQYLILAVAGIAALGLVIRMVLQWAQVNPFGLFAMTLRKWTEPVLRPLRKGFDNRFIRFDLLPLVAAVLLLMFAFFAANILSSFIVILSDMNSSRDVTVVRVFLWLLAFALAVYLGMLFFRFLLPYFEMGYSSRASRFLFRVTEPLLKPFRRLPLMGPVDFSPMLLILVLALVEQLIQNLMLSQ
jgi:YggT family protein